MVRIIDRWSETLTVDQAFRAVQELARIYWETGLKAEDKIAMFAAALEADPALETDWLNAIEIVREHDAHS